MIGNVWEWTFDWWTIEATTRGGPTNPVHMSYLRLSSPPFPEHSLC